MLKGTFTYLICLLCCAQPAIAQVSDSIWLNQVEIAAPRYRPSAYETSPDSLVLEVYRDRALGESLLSQAGVGIRNYAPGLLSALSLRGSSAAHTAVMWNGFNLQSMMNGQFDLNLVSMANVDELSINQGAAGAQAGSGAVGGMIHLKSLPHWASGWQLQQGVFIGSFGQERSTGQLSFGNRRLYSRSSWQLQRAQNQFPFENRSLPGRPIQKLENADQRFGQFAHDFHYRSKSLGQLSAYLHIQRANRQIPGPMTIPTPDSRQADLNDRLAFKWERSSEKWALNAGIAGMKELINYKDSKLALDETHQVRTGLWHIASLYKYSNSLQAGLRYEGSHFRALSPQYGTLRTQNRQAFIPELNWQRNRVLARVMARLERVDDRLVPLVPTFLAEYQVHKSVLIGTLIGNVYRLPTFNDLYWSPGGNPNLKEEWGRQLDIYARYKLRARHWLLEVQGNAYHLLINRWIAWLPGTFFWYAENVNQVTSEGLQGQGKLTFQKKKWIIRWQVQGQAGNSLFTADQDPDRGKQLPYVPAYSTAQSISIQFKHHFLLLEHAYTGYRFTDRQNRQFLSSYPLTHLSAGTSLKFGKLMLHGKAGIQNLLDTSYEMIEFRPMPGRSYFLSLNFQFNQLQ